MNEPVTFETTDLPPNWRDKLIDLPGRGTIWVRQVRGPEGAPTLALLHGLAATGRLNWFTALGALSEHFHLLVVDHRGHGHGIRTRHFRLADCADDVLAVADAVGVESLIAVGYSMGGPIAKLAWSRHPDRVNGLVLCATANQFMRLEARGVASAVFPGVVAAARAAPVFFRERIIERMLRDVPAGPGRERVRSEMSASDPATLLQATRAVIRFSSQDWASTIDVPTSVLITTRDELVSPERQYALAKSIRKARIFEVEGNHFACVRAVDRFVPTLVRACRYVAEEIEREQTLARSPAGPPNI
jgi:3-oxoadipate enol-lactonase